MSMPVNTYGCTSCDLKRWDSITWGYRYYLYGESKARMRVAIGWCFDCNDLGAIEVLPSAEGESARQKKVDNLQAGLLAEIAKNLPKKSWWQFGESKSNTQLKFEREIKSAEEALLEYQLSRAALSTRKSQARCLRCGAEQCVLLHPPETEYCNPTVQPIPISFEHPGCGGYLTIFNDGMRLNVRLTDNAYDLEGRFVAEVDSKSHG